MLQRTFFWDKVIGITYLIYQMRLPYKYLNSPEEHFMIEITVLTTTVFILLPLIMTIPFLMSRRWGAYLFIIMHLFTLVANRVTNQTPGPAQVVAILLVIYCLLRLTGKVGPPLNDWKDKLTST